MKLFVVAAMGAALLAGCAPFEHGHYVDDVSYRNTTGDPPGTPLVYRGDVTPTLATNRLDRSPSTDWRYSANNSAPRYQGSNRSYVSANEPAITPTYTQQSYAQPSYTQTAYAAPQSYVPAAQPTFAAAPAYAAPVQRRFIAQQVPLQPARQSTYAAAPVQQTNVLATSYGNDIRFDAEGYAICDIPGHPHAALQTPRYQNRF